MSNHVLGRRALALFRLLLLYGLLCALVLCAGLLRRAGWEAGLGLSQPLPPSTAPGADLPRLGITVQLEQYTPTQRRSALDALRAAGFGWVRQRFDWAALEPAPGNYTWDKADALINSIVDAGLVPVVVLDGSPVWACAPQDQPPTDNPSAPPADPALLARFAAAFAARYGDRTHFYQVWDEPNIAPHWGNRLIDPIGYAQLIKAVAPAIRAVDNDAVIVAAALAPTADRGHTAIDEVTYLQRLVAAGAAPALDVIAVQPFGFGHAPGFARQSAPILDFQRAAWIRRALVEMGLGTKPVWAARFGWNRRPNAAWGTVTAADQARYAVEAIDLAWTRWPWLTALGWASDRPDAPARDPRWGFALYERDGRAAPVLDAIRVRVQDADEAVLLRGEAGTLAAPGVSNWLVWLLICVLTLVVGWRMWAAARLVPWRAWMNAFRHAPWVAQAGSWALLLVIYYLATWPPLIGLCWLAWALLCWAQPSVGLGLAAALVPFYFQHKELHLVNGTLAVPPAAAALLCLLPVVAWRSYCLRWRPARADWTMLALVAISLLAVTSVWHWPAYAQGMIDLVLVPLGLWLSVRVLVKDDPVLPRHLAMALFAGGLLVALWGGVTWLRGQGVDADGVRRLVGPHFSPNQTALYLVRTLFLGLGLAMALGGRWRLLVFGATVLVLVALLLTGSRGALLLGVPAGSLFLGWRVVRRRPEVLSWPRRHWRWLAWSIAGCLVLVVAATMLSWERLLNAQTISLRSEGWAATLRLWRDHPLTGVGPGGFYWHYPAYLGAGPALEPNQLHPHNIWLEVASTWGLLGFLWLSAVILLALSARRDPAAPSLVTEGWLAAGLAAAFVAAVAHAQVDAFFLLPDLAAWNALAWALLVTRTPVYSPVYSIG